MIPFTWFQPSDGQSLVDWIADAEAQNQLAVLLLGRALALGEFSSGYTLSRHLFQLEIIDLYYAITRAGPIKEQKGHPTSSLTSLEHREKFLTSILSQRVYE